MTLERGEFRKAREQINSWAYIAIKLPEDFNPHYRRFLRDYFRAQLRVAQGNKIRARRIFEGLEKRAGYREFEEKCESYLAAVDLAVKGSTRWHARPAFTINHKD